MYNPVGKWISRNYNNTGLISLITFYPKYLTKKRKTGKKKRVISSFDGPLFPHVFPYFL